VPARGTVCRHDEAACRTSLAPPSPQRLQVPLHIMHNITVVYGHEKPVCRHKKAVRKHEIAACRTSLAPRPSCPPKGYKYHSIPYTTLGRETGVRDGKPVCRHWKRCVSMR
jgi:hypothetical protein